MHHPTKKKPTLKRSNQRFKLFDSTTGRSPFPRVFIQHGNDSTKMVGLAIATNPLTSNLFTAKVRRQLVWLIVISPWYAFVYAHNHDAPAITRTIYRLPLELSDSYYASRMPFVGWLKSISFDITVSLMFMSIWLLTKKVIFYYSYKF
jgi:hypothetical protein